MLVKSANTFKVLFDKIEVVLGGREKAGVSDSCARPVFDINDAASQERLPLVVRA